MNSTIIDPDYNWKQAASQEGVDYDAVRKSFMDQAYGLVANKAKVLFQDPFRLGFEVVHRNEKATKMTGFFAFRVNGAILYAPVFFLNGEIKPADMLYRGDVKRFVPLTDEWCTFLVRGANQESGQLVDKNRQRQPDAYMDRLAYPQRVKYAAEEQVKNAAEILREIMEHCAHDVEPEPLLPRFIAEAGPESLEKLAELIENSDTAKRHLATHYTEAQLMCLDGWQSKEAAAPTDPEAGNVVLVTGIEVVKSASEHSEIVRRGYALVDNRPEKSAAVVEEVEDCTIYEVKSPGYADIMMEDGSTEKLVLFSAAEMFRDPAWSAPPHRAGSHFVYSPAKKQILAFSSSNITLFGHQSVENDKVEDLGKSLSSLKVGDVVAFFSPSSLSCNEPVRITSVTKDGESTIISSCTRFGGREMDITYAPGRKTSGCFVGDDVRALPVDAEDDADAKCTGGTEKNFTTTWTASLMSPQGIDQWLRTAGGLTTSQDVTVKTNNEGLSFDIEHTGADGIKKVARDLGMLEAHLTLANDFEMRCDMAGKVLDKAVDDTVTRVRVYDTQTKQAFMTRAESMRPWLTARDNELNVKVDSPQRQVLQTHTPRRAEQSSRYGDHWDRGPEPQIPTEDGLPEDALLTRSPEELAQMSAQYQMPQIFDHGVLAQLAKSNFNTIAQVQQYVPDLETGVDRYYRILFLLRYRPSDFEEAYGKDELMEMEQELSELASMAGENLLRLLKRFDAGKFSRQGG